MMKTIDPTRLALIVAGLVALPSSALAVANIPEDEVFAREGRRELIHVRIQEGCDETAATDRVAVEIPDGVFAVIPQAVPGWTVTSDVVETDPYEIFGQERTDRVSNVTWSGGPLPADEFQDFGLFAVFTVPPGDLALPVTQGCGTEELSWTEVASDGEDAADLEFPAPVVRVVDPPDTDIPGLQKDLQSLRKDLDDLRTEFDGLRLGEIPGDRLRERISDLEQRLADFEAQLKTNDQPS